MKFVGNDKIIRKKNNHNFKFDIRFHLEPNIKLMKTKTNFIKVSSSSKIESHTHDVAIVKEPPNYQSR